MVVDGRIGPIGSGTLRNFLVVVLAAVGVGSVLSGPVVAQSQAPTSAEDLDLSPEIIEESPVLQRWLKEVPDVWEDIKNDPSFRTRLRLGYTQFPSSDDASGFNLAVEDVFIGDTKLTVGGDYYNAGSGDMTSAGAELRYYLFPLGNYVNFAPTIGYRHLETKTYSTSGLQVGGRLMVVPSRGGAADLSLSYSQVGIGGDESVGLASFSVGYAITPHLRLSTDLQWQIASDDTDNRVGIVLELMP